MSERSPRPLCAGLILLAALSLSNVVQAGEPVLPAQLPSYALPAHEYSTLREHDGTPADNPVTDAGATLGRVLFYDRQLSANGLVSCASCHTQASGFDDRTRFSIGLRGRITDRAAMPLVNARYNRRGRYFRDERAASLEEQVVMPLTDPVEMGLRPGDAVRRVREREWYGPLFAAAFGDPAVTERRIAMALAQFVRSIVSFGSRYDEARRRAAEATATFDSFTPRENRGKALFLTERGSGGAGCSACHETEAFVMDMPRNNGLDGDPAQSDAGLGGITGRQEEIGLFRAPSLKNVARTAPYMHDGRFATLDEVIEHYSSGVQDHPNLSPELRGEDGRPARLDLTPQDKAALVAFLETLSDPALAADPRFSDPFASGR